MYDNKAESPCSSEQEQYALFNLRQKVKDRKEALIDRLTQERMDELEQQIKDEAPVTDPHGYSLDD